MGKATDVIMLEIRLQRQVNALSQQRERIFELKALVKKLARVISQKHLRIKELERQLYDENNRNQDRT